MTDEQHVEPSRARRKLSLEEVRSAGLPASYQGFGERLHYVDGTIYDARDPSSPAEIPLGAADEADQAVGLEFGWQHAGDCACSLCSPEEAA
jgi:hypothetical protein